MSEEEADSVLSNAMASLNERTQPQSMMQMASNGGRIGFSEGGLTEYPNVHFVGDALSARGITVSGAHGIYVAEYLLTNVNND